MPADFDLIITADYPSRTAELRLMDAHGVQLAFRETDFKTITPSRRYGLFDLRNYLDHYVEEDEEAARVAEIGALIAEQVLGEEIFLRLWKSEAQRTLRIQLPGASEKENHLAASLACVPWEIARPSVSGQTLGERNLLVRVIHDMAAPPSQPLELRPGEPLRALFVFAEARGSRPLAARKERRELLDLFEKEIYPHRRVVADFLTHGVTRERLEAQIRENGGYHIVHWSGHGDLNLLELAKPGGAGDLLSGDELLDLFVKMGGFIPRLFFLSACHSGDIQRVKDWDDFTAVAQGKELGGKRATTEAPKEIETAEPPGYTGTAHALLQGGVPSVIAMRYAVSDDYARELSVEFYRALLAHAQPKDAGAALAMARRLLVDPAKRDLQRYAICDHATPVLYGENDPGLSLQDGRSPALNARNRRLHRIPELTLAGHEHFVGRTWELAELGAEFIGPSRGAAVKPVAVLTGLGGMGKTALVAEALELWEKRFEWALLHQAKPNRLEFDAWLRDIHTKLYAELGRYHDHVKEHPADAIYRAPSDVFVGLERVERLTRNLVRALRDEAILLVLDNFETNLKTLGEPVADAGEPRWACQDPAWDRCLAQLATELIGAPSRVLITSRRPLAALIRTARLSVILGPLPPGEAALYLQEHAGLSRMFFNGDAGERALAMRLLNASRFHPLLMDRLARLATGGAALRAQLMQALETLEQSKDFAQLPALFAPQPGDAQELAYLNDALASSLDQLIHDASPEARRLLWMIAVANEPVELDMFHRVWRDLAQPEPAPFLRHLIAVGLVTEEIAASEDENPALTCHELARERIHAWMHNHPQDHDGLTENGIRLSYAKRLAAQFKALRNWNMTAALQAGSRALVYCVQSGDYKRLGVFASEVIVNASDPHQLESLLPHLEAAAEAAPDGRPRLYCLSFLADALARSGHPDASLPLYEQIAAQVRAAAQSGGENAQQEWAFLAAVNNNWASTLLMTGEIDAALQRHRESAEAEKKAGRPAVYVIMSELEALRINIRQGQSAQALPQVEERLAKLESWWQKSRTGQFVPDAPDPVSLARAFIGALDIVRQAHFANEDWKSALPSIEVALEVQQALEYPLEEIAITHGNRAIALGNLGRFGEARAELEDCLQVFQNNPANLAITLHELADLFDKQDDVAQAIQEERRALALREGLPDPGDRAISHHYLAKYLERSGTPSDLAESSRHRLAALIYFLVAGLEQGLQTSRQNYVVRFSRAYGAGTPLIVPSVAELLTDITFRPLADWLRQRQMDVDKLQAKVDQIMEKARQAVLEQRSSSDQMTKR